MNKKRVQKIVMDAKSDNEKSHNEEVCTELELTDYMEKHIDTLSADPVIRFIQLTDNFLGGKMGIQTYRRRTDEHGGRLWITEPEHALLREPNRFLRLTDNLKKVLLLGSHILGPDKMKTCIESILELVRDQPIIRAVRCAEIDTIECWLLLNLVNCHFEDRELNDLYKACRFTDMPTSYLGRLANRMQEGTSGLVNEGFIHCIDHTAYNFSLMLTHKTLGLIVNPYQLREAG